MNRDTVTASAMPLTQLAPGITINLLCPRRFRIRTVAKRHALNLWRHVPP
jgi:hypothetical protein